MKFQFFHTNGFRNMKMVIWEMTHLYVRNHVLWKLDQLEWFAHTSTIADEIKETLRS